MKFLHSLFIALALVLIAPSCLSADANAPTAQVPFQLAPDLFDHQQADLGLTEPAGISHSLVYSAADSGYHYNHGAVLFAFKDRLYVQWQSSREDEDAADTQVKYAWSSDGIHWSQAQTLASSSASELVTNGGWWTYQHRLIALLNHWPYNNSPKQGYVTYSSSLDASHWTPEQPLRDAQAQPLQGVMEQDLKALPSGRILSIVHRPPGLIATPFYTDDPSGLNGWTPGQFSNLEHAPGISRELEPSWFAKANGELVMVFRDQGSSFRVLAATSRDQGASWSQAQLTDMPDARAKQSAGNLPNGWAFMVNNPSGSKSRTPLVVSLSTRGEVFSRAFLLGSTSALPPMKFAGKYKRPGYSYPKSLVWRDRLWVSYGRNKEDIVVTSVPIASLVTTTATSTTTTSTTKTTTRTEQ